MFRNLRTAYRPAVCLLPSFSRFASFPIGARSDSQILKLRKNILISSKSIASTVSRTSVRPPPQETGQPTVESQTSLGEGAGRVGDGPQLSPRSVQDVDTAVEEGQEDGTPSGRSNSRDESSNGTSLGDVEPMEHIDSNTAVVVPSQEGYRGHGQEDLNHNLIDSSDNAPVPSPSERIDSRQDITVAAANAPEGDKVPQKRGRPRKPKSDGDTKPRQCRLKKPPKPPTIELTPQEERVYTKSALTRLKNRVRLSPKKNVPSESNAAEADGGSSTDSVSGVANELRFEKEDQLREEVRKVTRQSKIANRVNILSERLCGK